MKQKKIMPEQLSLGFGGSFEVTGNRKPDFEPQASLKPSWPQSPQPDVERLAEPDDPHASLGGGLPKRKSRYSR